MKSLVIFSALAATGAIAGAQVKTEIPDSTCTKYSDGRIQCRVYRRGNADSLFRRMTFRMDSVMANRAALGVEVRSTGSKRDTLGVFVESVTPKGPAENAGIVEGDRIASINGVDLRTASADLDDEYARDVGARRLSREMQKFTPGSRLTLRLYSGGRFRDVQVVAGKASDLVRMRTVNFRMPAGGFEYFGPDRVFGPDRMMVAPQMPKMLRQDIEPMIRERLRDLPERIQLRTLPKIRSLRVLPRTYRVDRGSQELGPGEGNTSVYIDDDMSFNADEEPYMLLDSDEEPDIIFNSDDGPDLQFVPDFDAQPFEFEYDVEPVSSETIRDLAATAARDARAALTRLSAAGIV